MFFFKKSKNGPQKKVYTSGERVFPQKVQKWTTKKKYTLLENGFSFKKWKNGPQKKNIHFWGMGLHKSMFYRSKKIIRPHICRKSNLTHETGHEKIFRKGKRRETTNLEGRKNKNHHFKTLFSNFAF